METLFNALCEKLSRAKVLNVTRGSFDEVIAHLEKADSLHLRGMAVALRKSLPKTLVIFIEE